MSAPADHEAIRRGFDAWNSGDLERFLETIHPEVVWEPSGAFPGIPTRYEGHDGVRQFWSDFMAPWERVSVENEEIRVLEPHEVLVRVTFTAEGRAGIEVDQEFGHRYSIRDGLLYRMHSYGSWQDALTATGASAA